MGFFLALTGSQIIRALREGQVTLIVGVPRLLLIQRLASRLAGVVPIDPKKGVLSSLAFGAAVLKDQKSLNLVS